MAHPGTPQLIGHCQLDPARAAALLIALDRVPMVTTGTPLPPFFHQVYFWDAAPPGRLGRDGHPQVGGIIPDMGLPRRMWAGGRLDFHAPLLAGHPAEKRTVLDRTARKTGRSGPLGFVTLRHEVWQDGRLRVTEWQDLVYRGDPTPGAPPATAPTARTDEDRALPLRFDTTLLFRYSALTLNGHRIHYDADYARAVEGYGGPVVHGPLLAQLMMLEADDRTPGGLRRFTFRATAPLELGQAATLCASGPDLWIRAGDGRQIMQASAA